MIRHVTIKDINRILKFLPLLQEPAETYFKVHQDKPAEGVISMPFWEYGDTVANLFIAIYETGLATTKYACTLHDSAKLAKADIKAIAKCLTFHNRGERFCDGHIAGKLKNGHIQAILKQLSEIRKSFPDDLNHVVWVNRNGFE
jgi:hypothetical protein